MRNHGNNIVLALLLIALTINVCFAKVNADADSDEATQQDLPRGTINSVDALNLGETSASSLSRAAEYCVREGQFDKAIKYSRMALDKNYDDNEIHQIYAEALEGKLDAQVQKDPAIFNQCVKEWLSVLRQENGDEKLTFHGIGVPLTGRFYGDQERVTPARHHLLQLTGYAPKGWETDERYLRRVLKPANAEVAGEMLNKRPSRPDKD